MKSDARKLGLTSRTATLAEQEYFFDVASPVSAWPDACVNPRFHHILSDQELQMGLDRVKPLAILVRITDKNPITDHSSAD